MDWSIGNVVSLPSRPQWGLGEIIEVRDLGKVVVRFSRVGTKVLKGAPLTLVSETPQLTKVMKHQFTRPISHETALGETTSQHKADSDGPEDRRGDTTDLDPDASITIDLHGYKLSSALQIAEEWIRCAWHRGLREIRFIHGAQDVTESESGAGRGVIKWKLRALVRSGRLAAWCYDAPNIADYEHQIAFEYAINIQPNPHPDTHYRWPRLPPLDFVSGGDKFSSCGGRKSDSRQHGLAAG